MSERPPESEILLYQTEDGDTRLEIRMESGGIWLSLNQLAALFQRDKSVISKHLKNIIAEGELDAASAVANFATTAADGKTYQVDYYALYAVIAVGYRVKSHRGTQFRIWATRALKEYAQKGFTLDDARHMGQHQRAGYFVGTRCVLLALCLLLQGCSQKAAITYTAMMSEAAVMERGGVNAEIIGMSVAVPYSSGYARPEGIHIKVRGLTKVTVSKDSVICVLARTAIFYAGPADILMYKVIFIPMYAIQGAGQALARGESRPLRQVIFVDLIRRVMGKDGRWEDDARDQLYVDSRVPSVRVGYWRNVYNWTDWFSPFLGIGRMGFNERAHFLSTTDREWRRESGKVVFVDGMIPPEFIRQVGIFAPDAKNVIGGATAEYVPPVDIENSSGTLYKVDLDWELLSTTALRVGIEDLNGNFWVGDLDEQGWVILEKSLAEENRTEPERP